MTVPNMTPTEAEGWRPEAGDMIVGTVEDIDLGWSDFRGQYPILTIRAGAGTKSTNVAPGQSVKLHCFHDVLFSRVATLRPVPGETVGVQFHGQQAHRTRPNQTVSRYTFKVSGRGANAASLYDQLTPGGRQQQQQPQQPATPSVPAGQQDFRPEVPPAPGDDDIPF